MVLNKEIHKNAEWAELNFLYICLQKKCHKNMSKNTIFHQSWSLMLHMFRKNKNRVQLQGNSSPIFNTCVYIYLNFVSLGLLQIIYSNWQCFSVVDCNGKYVSLLLLLSGNSIQQLSTQKAPMEPSHPTSFSTGQNLCSFWVLTDPYENTWRPPPPPPALWDCELCKWLHPLSETFNLFI